MIHHQAGNNLFAFPVFPQDKSRVEHFVCRVKKDRCDMRTCWGLLSPALSLLCYTITGQMAQLIYCSEIERLCCTWYKGGDLCFFKYIFMIIRLDNYAFFITHVFMFFLIYILFCYILGLLFYLHLHPIQFKWEIWLSKRTSAHLCYVYINAVFLLSGSDVSSQWRLTAVTAHRQLWVCVLSGLAWFE